MRLMMLQYGDYAEAVRRFATGGSETYYGQRYSVDFLATLASEIVDVTVLTFSRDMPETRLANGVRCLGVHLHPPGRRAQHFTLLRTLKRLRPDHLIVFSPQPIPIAWGLAFGIRTPSAVCG